MLVIRATQMAEMNRCLVERRIEDFILEFSSDRRQQAPQDLSPEMVKKIAGGYGVTALRDLREFVSLVMEIGLRFEAQPEYQWIAKTLRDPGVSSAADRLARVRDLMKRQALRERANAQAESLFWDRTAARAAKSTAASAMEPEHWKATA